MKKLILLMSLSFFIAGIAKSQSTPSADVILKDAYAKAAKENKKVLVIFHASWCGWCRKMDASLNDVSVKGFFDKNYVITHLTIMESDDKKKLENPGALDLKNKWADKVESIPYWVILDKDGKLLGDAQIEPGENVGCPATEKEVKHFTDLLRKTSSITDEQVAAVEKRFRKNDE
jgi:thioredoxin-related protein